MGQDLKAENLSICTPSSACDKRCPYCVSRMTTEIKYNQPLMRRNIFKVKKMAECAEVTSVLFTGKGEPTLDLSELYYMMKVFEDFQIELQTNGKSLLADIAKTGGDNIMQLYIMGLNVLAVSLDDINDFKNMSPLFRYAQRMGIVTRATVNISDKLNNTNFRGIVHACQANYLEQLTFRRLSVPSHPRDTTIANWIENHAPDKLWEWWVDMINQGLKKEGILLRQLNHGVTVWDYQGLSLSWSDYCIQETNQGNNVRSLIFQGDGHLYTSWNSKASIIL